MLLVSPALSASTNNARLLFSFLVKKLNHKSDQMDLIKMKVRSECEVPISLSSLSDITGGSGSGGEAFVGGGPQGQPPYMVLQSDKTVKTNIFCTYFHYCTFENCELFIRLCIPNQNQIALM